MLKKLLIVNDVPFHYEIIPSVIKKYREILEDDTMLDLNVFLYIVDDYPERNNAKGFVSYIKKEFDHIEITQNSNLEDFDYVISCTAVSESSPKEHGPTRPSNMIKNSKNIFYIAHDIDDELLAMDNVFFLSKMNRNDIPLKKVFKVDTLPNFSNVKSKPRSNTPTFLIQGSFVRAALDNTRNYGILEEILSHRYEHDFIINIVGSWHLPEKFDIWEFVNIDKVLPENIQKIHVHLNLDWNDYNLYCSSADAIIPLISSASQPQYFYTKATSSIGYIQSYSLGVFCDKDFAKTYQIPKNKTFLYDRSSIKKSFAHMISKYSNNRI